MTGGGAREKRGEEEKREGASNEQITKTCGQRHRCYPRLHHPQRRSIQPTGATRTSWLPRAGGDDAGRVRGRRSGCPTRC